MNLRPEFHAIVAGWTMDDFDGITERLEQLMPLHPYNDDEHKTVEMMVKYQIAKGIMRGDFDFTGVPREKLVEGLMKDPH